MYSRSYLLPIVIKKPKLTNAQTIKLFQFRKRNLKKIVYGNLAYLINICRHWRRRSGNKYDLDELLNVAGEGLILAVHHYNPKLNPNFMNYASTTYVLKSLEDFIMKDRSCAVSYHIIKKLVREGRSIPQTDSLDQCFDNEDGSQMTLGDKLEDDKYDWNVIDRKIELARLLDKAKLSKDELRLVSDFISHGLTYAPVKKLNRANNPKTLEGVRKKILKILDRIRKKNSITAAAIE